MDGKVGEVGTRLLGRHIEIKIFGWGNTGKGDRSTSLSKGAARKLAFRLLAQAEDIDSTGKPTAQ